MSVFTIYIGADQDVSLYWLIGQTSAGSAFKHNIWVIGYGIGEKAGRASEQTWRTPGETETHRDERKIPIG